MNDLFNAEDIPFNLAGEQIDNSTTAEGEARVRALAEAETRKAQRTFDDNKPKCTCGYSPCWNGFDL